MSNLNPGGSRARGGRIFSTSAITKVCESKQHDGSTSIAGKSHQHNRERERNLRRAAKKETSE